VSVILAGDEPLQTGATYVFFADYKPNGNLTVPPFGRLQAEAGGLAPLPEWTNMGALRELTGVPVDDAAAVIEEAD
jgi:hypothetical protein